MFNSNINLNGRRFIHKALHLGVWHNKHAS